jgi:parvulin-like peptidyl-prolyl isomerase
MNPISPFSTTLISILALLITLSGVVAAESDSEFQINGKPVPKIVAKVNGTKLTSDLLKREMIAYRLLASKQGETMEATDEEKVARGLLMKAIDDELIYQQGLKQRINIDSATIDRELNHIQSQFPGKKLFLAALAAQRLTFDILKKKIKKTLVKEEFVRATIASKVQVDDDNVKSFYDQNTETFITPETFKISHIYVTIPAAGDGDADSPKDRAKAKEIIDWVISESRNKINQASLALKSGKSFASVAKDFSEDPKTAGKGGDLGFIMKNQTLPEISSSMLKLKLGEVSNVITSSLGFHIIQLNNKKESQILRLAEVKAEILNHLLKLETEIQLKKYLADIRKKSKIEIFI